MNNMNVDLSVENVCKSYRHKEVLNNISFSAEKGDIIGIIGSNGSGKSTLLSVLSGVLSADSGLFSYNGCNLFDDSKIRADIIGYVPQGNPLIEELTAWDNLLLWADRRMVLGELESGVLGMLGINEFIKVPVRKMSGGMKKRLSIGCTVINSPKVLLLDEPCAALDIVCREKIYDYYRAYTGSGGIIIMVTHELSEIAMCDTCYILRSGGLEEYQYDGDGHRLAGML